MVVVWELKAVDKADKKGTGSFLPNGCCLGWLKAIDKVAQKGMWELLARVLFWGWLKAVDKGG